MLQESISAAASRDEYIEQPLRDGKREFTRLRSSKSLPDDVPTKHSIALELIFGEELIRRRFMGK